MADTEELTPERDGYLRAEKVFAALEGCRLDVALTVLCSCLVMLAKSGKVSLSRLTQSLHKEWREPKLEGSAIIRKDGDKPH